MASSVADWAAMRSRIRSTLTMPSTFTIDSTTASDQAYAVEAISLGRFIQEVSKDARENSMCCSYAEESVPAALRLRFPSMYCAMPSCSHTGHRPLVFWATKLCVSSCLRTRASSSGMVDKLARVPQHEHTP